VIWNLFLPRRMRRKRDMQSHPQLPWPNAVPEKARGLLCQRLDSFRAHRQQVLESPSANPRLQRAWECVTGRGPNGYILLHAPNFSVVPLS
jgi:hypothetical protein